MDTVVEKDIELTEVPEGAAPYADIIRHIIYQRILARELEEEAKRIKAEANLLYTGIAKEAGFKSVTSNMGMIYLQETSGKASFKKDLAKDALLKAGVPSDTVVKAFEDATKIGKPSTSVAFRSPEEIK